ncbi:MAG: DUF934 domain-containing protein [Pseudomonadota bacterium]|nr:DUF934 domain-containing protein [Pseudomonadota bacterium]
MARYFPIFIDLGGSPPLVVGARPALAAKLQLLAGLVPSKSSVVAIRFYRFSDGRGFTIARRLREALGHSGAILASGHLIPDQAGYLRRCGFSHAEIAPGSLRQWRLSLSLSPPPMQQLLSGRRARDQDAASS